MQSFDLLIKKILYIQVNLDTTGSSIYYMLLPSNIKFLRRYDDGYEDICFYRNNKSDEKLLMTALFNLLEKYKINIPRNTKIYNINHHSKDFEQEFFIYEHF